MLNPQYITGCPQWDPALPQPLLLALRRSCWGDGKVLSITIPVPMNRLKSAGTCNCFWTTLGYRIVHRFGLCGFSGLARAVVFASVAMPFELRSWILYCDSCTLLWRCCRGLNNDQYCGPIFLYSYSIACLEFYLQMTLPII